MEEAEREARERVSAAEQAVRDRAELLERTGRERSDAAERVARERLGALEREVETRADAYQRSTAEHQAQVGTGGGKKAPAGRMTEGEGQKLTSPNGAPGSARTKNGRNFILLRPYSVFVWRGGGGGGGGGVSAVGLGRRFRAFPFEICTYH